MISRSKLNSLVRKISIEIFKYKNKQYQFYIYNSFQQDSQELQICASDKSNISVHNKSKEHKYQKWLYSHYQNNNKYQIPVDKTQLARQFPNEELPSDKVPGSWKSLRDIYQKNTQLKGSEIGPQDISQGILGDCYLIAALSSLSLKPNLVEKLFMKRERNTKCQIYGIYLCNSGMWEFIKIDDCVPYENDRALFSTSETGNIWGILLEKAYAKLFGSYHFIASGYGWEAFPILTGAPCTVFYQSEEQNELKEQKQGISKGELQRIIEIKHWEFIEKAIQASYLMTASTFSSQQNSQNQNKQSGIIAGHEYSVLNALKIKIKSKLRKVIQLRNPWGIQTLKGQLKKESNEISEYLGMKTNLHKSTGSFWLYFENYHKYYEYTVQCMINENYFYQAFKVQTNGQEYSLIKFQVEEFLQEAFIIITQPISRNSKVENQDEIEELNKFSHILLYLFKEEDNNPQNFEIEKLSGGRKQQIFLNVTNLKAGEYMIFVDIVWELQSQNDFTISIYSDRKVKNFELSSFDEEGFFISSYLNLHFRLAETIISNPKFERQIINLDSQLIVVKYIETLGIIILKYFNNSIDITYEFVRDECVGVEVIWPSIRHRAFTLFPYQSKLIVARHIRGAKKFKLTWIFLSCQTIIKRQKII